MSEAEPLLSVVVTSRNDNHGGTLLRRMQTFVNHLLAQCQRHQLHAELIIVEWNPPADRPPLVEALRWPDEHSLCRVRIIEVPAALHQRFRHAQALPLFQMIAKNVGIRRARGRFVLATNIDILFSDELMQFLASGRLRPECMVRIDRMDVMTEVPVDAPVEEQLAFCQGHYLRRNARDDTIRLDPDGTRYTGLYPNDVVTPADGIRFGSGFSRPETWAGERQRWAEAEAVLLVEPPAAALHYLSLVLEDGPSLLTRPLVIEVHGENAPVVRAVLGGRHRLHLSLPMQPGQRNRFVLRVCGSVVPMEDGYTRCYRLLHAGWSNGPDSGSSHVAREGNRDWVVEEVSTQAPEDIASDPGIRFGCGFGAVEIRKGERFRWVRREQVRLQLAARPGQARVLMLELEPGPGLLAEGFELQLRDDSRQVVASGKVEGHQRVYLTVPGLTEQPRWFDLVAAGKMDDACEHWRYQVFKVFRCAWSDRQIPAGSGQGLNFAAEWVHQPQPWDARSSEVAIRFGPGWYQPEEAQDQEFRWGRDGAVLEVSAAAQEPTRALHLELESASPGRDRRVNVHLCDSHGQVLAQASLGPRRVVSLPVNLSPGQTQRFRLHTDGNRALSETDPRTLHFRIFLPGQQRPPLARMARRAFRPLRGLLKLLTKRKEPGPLSDAGLVELETGVGDVSRVPSGPVILPQNSHGGTIPGNAVAPVHLHCNACGDFTLVAREHWLALRGYPELEIYSLHIDSLFCYMAYHAGLEEEILADPLQVYHIEHSAGSGWTPEGEDKLFQRMQTRGVPVLKYETLVEWSTEMRRRGRPLQFNREDWGLGTEQLPETTPR
jgi:hypothetical protein